MEAWDVVDILRGQCNVVYFFIRKHRIILHDQKKQIDIRSTQLPSSEKRIARCRNVYGFDLLFERDPLLG